MARKFPLNNKPPIIETKSVTKTYLMGSKKKKDPEKAIKIKALDSVSVKINKGEMVAIMGKSGSGKSTLMHIIGLLDRPSSGKIYIDGQDVSKLGLDDQAKLRSQKIGFVFQSFNLLARTKAIDNVALPLSYAGVSSKERNKRAQEMLEKVGLGDRAGNHPNQLSGGEQQRVAIARALVNSPSLILADEPTGNLDTKSGNAIEDLLKQIHKEGNTVVVVTHDETLAKKCGRVVELVDGRVA
jgi:putative ABC transport system ATP-binding protein